MRYWKTFPPSQKNGKIVIVIFLKHAAKELFNRDGKIIHIDIVVITEIPRSRLIRVRLKKHIKITCY